MATEIELKFFINQSIIKMLPNFLARWSFDYQGKQTLSNCYYETADHFLRDHQLGLRIRSFNNQYEMTLKTSGRVVAGLHQRPEYNIALTEPQLAIELLPHDVWPQATNISELVTQLSPLFSTDFIRESWLIHFQESDIELALDCGEIRSGEKTEPLHEIELELKQSSKIELDEALDLKQGTVQDVLSFAQQLCQFDGLRLSSKSKAARGYSLAESGKKENIKPLPVFHELEKLNVEQALQKAIELTLSYWQYHEELWLTGNQDAKMAVLDAIQLLQQILVVWHGSLPKERSQPLSQQLTQLAALLAKHEAAETICYFSVYTSVKLILTQWVITPLWRDDISVEQFQQLSSPFSAFAKTELTRLTGWLTSQLAETVNDVDSVAFRPQVSRYILTVPLLAGAYSEQVIADYLMPWQQLDSAMKALHSEPDQHNDITGLIEKRLNQSEFWRD